MTDVHTERHELTHNVFSANPIHREGHVIMELILKTRVLSNSQRRPITTKHQNSARTNNITKYTNCSNDQKITS